MAARGWTDAELRASIDAYKDMASREAAGEPASKKSVFLDLSKRFGRTAKSFEFRLRNISAVLADRGDPWIAGLYPAENIGGKIKARILAILDDRSLSAQEALPKYQEFDQPIREWLIAIARASRTVTYGDVMDVFGLARSALNPMLEALGRQSQKLGEPVITALVVRNDTGRSSPGLREKFGVLDDEAERSRIYEWWSIRGSPVQPRPAQDQSFSVRAARFAAVEIRPGQAAFRRLVFHACQGRCVVSGCNIEEALDAAHRKGRDWRQGHNLGTDGFLLRKDLHALYDAGLLRIVDGFVEIDSSAAPHYAELAGVQVKYGDLRPAEFPLFSSEETGE